jgi:hypothetical protein
VIVIMKALNALKSYAGFVNDEMHSDDADTVLVTVVMLWPLIMLLMGWSVDFAKNIVIRSDLDEIALEAVQAGIRNQDGLGNIDCTNTGWLTKDGAISLIKNSEDTSGATTTKHIGGATKQALKTYLVKTGRAAKNDFIDSATKDMRGNLYNSSDDSVNEDAASNDSQEVLAYRSFMNNGNGADADSDEGATAFRIKIICGNKNHRIATSSNYGVDPFDIFNSENSFRGVDNALSYDSMTIEVKDWTANFFLGNPLTNAKYKEDAILHPDVNRDTGVSGLLSGGYGGNINYRTDETEVQRFEVTQTAISSWSQSTLNKNDIDNSPN